MSKRFGRNQKRRMRETLAATQAALDKEQAVRVMDRGLLRRQSAQLLEADAFARDVAGMVGRQAIIAGEPVLLDYQIPKGLDRVKVIPQFQLPSLESTMTAMPTKIVRDETLRLLDVEIVRDRMNCPIHALVKLADKTVAYGISEHALAHMTVGELERLLAPQIARAIAHKLKSA